MLTPGNKTLGGRLIWGFGLPSGRPEICTGMSAECHEHCYSRQMERLRPAVLTRYEKNLRVSRLPDFVERVHYFILNHEIAVVRLHVGGEFYSPRYPRKWLRIMRRLPDVRFFVYSRAWRDDHIRAALERMTQLPNCCLCYSCDKGTGVPGSVTPRVRLAWLMTDANDLPLADASLTFRIRRLRRQPQTHVGGVRVCPAEDGLPKASRITCDRCGLCWRPLPAEPWRIPLPLREPSERCPASFILTRAYTIPPEQL
jgi:Gene product 88